MDDFTLLAPSPPVDPFIKWAGGKRQLLRRLRQWYPQSFSGYVEPFLGGGAVFFDLESQGRLQHCQTTLSDRNGDLIGCCLMVRDHIDEVIRALTDLATGHSEDGHYNQVREVFNRQRRPLLDRTSRMSDGYTPGLAAQFIYLNRTGFNGMFRVNTKGTFNIPIGRYANPTICDVNLLRRVSAILRRPSVRLLEADFEGVLNDVHADAFVYCDPPYAPLSGTSKFTAYTSGGFDDADQRAPATAGGRARASRLLRDGVELENATGHPPLCSRRRGPRGRATGARGVGETEHQLQRVGPGTDYRMRHHESAVGGQSVMRDSRDTKTHKGEDASAGARHSPGAAAARGKHDKRQRRLHRWKRRQAGQRATVRSGGDVAKREHKGLNGQRSSDDIDLTDKE